MTRILLIGYAPPLLQPNVKVEAAHYRAWQFMQPLLDSGHRVCLCVDQTSGAPASVSLPENLCLRSVPFDTPAWSHRLQAVHDSFQPDCVVAVDSYPALFATKLRTPKPIWMDIYGDALTISQVARYRAGSDQGIFTTISLMKQVLQRGDVFSVCGIPQQHLLVGELAMCGRLNSRTFGYNFTRVIYPGAAPVRSCDNSSAGSTLRRSLGISSEAFVVLWCGGYNTWTDVSTLFKALEWAMEHDSRIHYVSVGASTYQASETAYERFANLAAQSRHAPRYHLVGWRPWDEIPDLYLGSDVGVNIDALHYETIYGTRTRLVEMLAYGLPVITSEGCELSYIVQDKSCGLGFPTGDWKKMAQHILQLAADPVMLRSMRQAAHTVTTQDLAFGTTMKPLLTWVQDPEPAPDNAPQKLSAKIQAKKFRVRTVARMLLWKLGLSGRRKA